MEETIQNHTSEENSSNLTSIENINPNLPEQNL